MFVEFTLLMSHDNIDADMAANLLVYLLARWSHFVIFLWLWVLLGLLYIVIIIAVNVSLSYFISIPNVSINVNK